LKFLAFLSVALLLLAHESHTLRDIKEGKEIYESTCISCHGANGETNADMLLIVKPRKLQKTILSRQQSFQIIKEGARYWGAHSDLMPAFKYVYDDKQIKSVAAYMQHAFNDLREARIQKLLAQAQRVDIPEEKMLQKGKKIFQRTCSLCHGIKGDAKSAYVEESKKSKNFIYPYNLRRTLLSEDQIFLYAKYGGHFWGTDKSDMPSWKKKYNDEELKSVAKYVHQEIKQLKE